jgi:hypothetical protein
VTRLYLYDSSHNGSDFISYDVNPQQYLQLIFAHGSVTSISDSTKNILESMECNNVLTIVLIDLSQLSSDVALKLLLKSACRPPLQLPPSVPPTGQYAR